MNLVCSCPLHQRKMSKESSSSGSNSIRAIQAAKEEFETALRKRMSGWKPLRRSQLSSDTFENDPVNIGKSRGKEDYTPVNKFRHVETICSNSGYDLNACQIDTSPFHDQAHDVLP